MAERDKIISFLDEYLQESTTRDSAMNGLQVEGKEEVNNIVLGVSVSMQLFNKAIEQNADMIIVHHGLYWGESFPIKGFSRERIWSLLKNKISLVAYHIPLDKHPVVGNNAQLLKLFDTKHTEPFAKYKGATIGFKAELKCPVRIDHITEILKRRLGSESLCYNFGKESISKIGVVSGGAPEMIYQAIDDKIDLFLTGEATEYVQEMAREAKINFISAGHYNTEKLGIQALGELLKEQFNVKTQFIDIPNPV